MGIPDNVVADAVARYDRERDRYLKLAARVADICRADIVEANAIRGTSTAERSTAPSTRMEASYAWTLFYVDVYAMRRRSFATACSRSGSSALMGSELVFDKRRTRCRVAAVRILEQRHVQQIDTKTRRASDAGEAISIVKHNACDRLQEVPWGSRKERREIKLERRKPKGHDERG